MSEPLTHGAYQSYKTLCEKASISAKNYAIFPAKSSSRNSVARWRDELLDAKCIKEIVVGEKCFYQPMKPLQELSFRSVARGRKPKLLATSTAMPIKQQTLIPPIEPPSNDIHHQQKEGIISLTPGAFESFCALYQNIKKAKAKSLPFPRMTNNRGSVVRWREELLAKKCIKRVEAERDRLQYIPIVEPFQVATIGDNRGARRTEIAGDAPPVQEQAIAIQHEHPVSRGRHLPNGHLLIEFVNAVQRELHVLRADRMSKISDEIAQAKIELTNTGDMDYEKLYLREIQKLVTEREKLNDQALIDAIKYVESKKEFSAYKWAGEIVSIRPEDYTLMTIE